MPEEWRSVIGNKRHKDELAKQFKDNDSPLKIAIVVAVLHGLCHVIDVNIIAEDFSGASVFCGYGRSCKADIGSVWETVADNAGCTDLDFSRCGMRPCV